MENLNICGIYLLRFVGTDKVYIGKSKNIATRWTKHKQNFRNSSTSIKLQEAYKLYGMPSIEVLVECRENETLEIEREAISIFNSVKNGFNTYSEGSEDNSVYGDTHHNSVYSNSNIILVLELLTHTPIYTYDYIASITGVNISTIAMISCGYHHRWLSTEYPILYSKMIDLLGNRKHIAVHPNIEKIVAMIEYSNINPSITGKELSLLFDISKDIIASVSSGRTARDWLTTNIPISYGIFMDRKYNKSITNSKTTSASLGKIVPTIISPDGVLYNNISNISQFCREHNLAASAIGMVIRGIRNSHKGWKVQT